MIKTRYNRKQLDIKLKYLKSLGAKVSQQGHNYYASMDDKTVLTAIGSYAGYKVEVDPRFQYINKR